MTERESGKKIAFSKDERDQVLKNFLIQVKNQRQEQQKPVEVQENLRRNKVCFQATRDSFHILHEHLKEWCLCELMIFSCPVCDLSVTCVIAKLQCHFVIMVHVQSK